MYATLSYDVSVGPTPVEDVRKAILDVFDGRLKCDLLSDTFICEVENTADYLSVARALKRAATSLDEQFQFVFTLHAAGAALRSNASFSKAKAAEIIDPGDDE
jgi:hypothetical protein